MPINYDNEESPEPEEQHREYLYDLLDQRAELLTTKHRPDEGDLAELAQIENIFSFYRIEVERDQ